MQMGEEALERYREADARLDRIAAAHGASLAVD